MKQHITIEQLRELNSDQEMKLMEWYRPKYVEFVRGDPDYQCYRLTGHEYGQDGFCKVCFNPSHEKKYSSSTPALLSIGQMIEFLDENKEKLDLNGEDMWYEPRIEFQQMNGNLFFSMQWDEELCDALWEAVKSIL